MSSFNIKNASSGWLFKDKKEHIANIRFDDFRSYASKELTDFKSVGSYNWSIDSTPNMPVIIVPGTANLLKENIACYQQLIRSSREQICDENRYFMEEYSMEPLFQAVQHCTPEFDFKTVDLVTDRNNLRKLLSFVEKNAKGSFRIEAQLFNNETLIFVRNDEKIIMPSNDFGKDFEEKCSHIEPTRSGSYRQIVTYKLGDIRVLCRFEVDGIESTNRKVLPSANLKLKNPKSFIYTSKLHYIESGQLIDSKKEKIAEMTTKAIYQGNYEFPKYKLDQLLLSNTDMLLIGWHERGMLKKVEKLPLEEVTKRCGLRKADIQLSMGKLREVILMIKGIIKNQTSPQQKFALVYDMNSDRSSLEVFSVNNQSNYLPPDLVARLF